MGRLQSIGCSSIRHVWGQLFRTLGIYRTLLFYIQKFQKLVIGLVTRCMQKSDLARTIGFRKILAYPVLLGKFYSEWNYPNFRIQIINFGHMCARMWPYSSMRSSLAGHLAYWTLFVTNWHVCHKLTHFDTEWNVPQELIRFLFAIEWHHMLTKGKLIVCHKLTSLNSVLLIKSPLAILHQLALFTY